MGMKAAQSLLQIMAVGLNSTRLAECAALSPAHSGCSVVVRDSSQLKHAHSPGKQTQWASPGVQHSDQAGQLADSQYQASVPALLGDTAVLHVEEKPRVWKQELFRPTLWGGVLQGSEAGN